MLHGTAHIYFSILLFRYGNDNYVLAVFFNLHKHRKVLEYLRKWVDNNTVEAEQIQKY